MQPRSHRAAARLAAYRTVQERLAELDPFLLYPRSGAAMITNEDLRGVAVNEGLLAADRPAVV